MSWNYRVIRTKITWEETFSDTTSEEFYYGYEIREVYYNMDGSIKVVTVKQTPPYGDTVAELAEDLELFKLALSRPVLELVDGVYVEVGNGEEK